MSLPLDARQRAMLQEMGITVWAPAPVAPPIVAPSALKSPTLRADAPPAAAPQAPQIAPTLVATATMETRAAPAPTMPPVTQAGAPAALWVHPPAALYAVDSPAPPGLGATWLVVTESLTPQTPFADDAGKLLDAMLRAMQLHTHPRVFLAALERPRPGHTAPALEQADPTALLADAVRSLQPGMVLLMGHVAARAALNDALPLGRLRAQMHTLQGCPALVTYDPAFLLRSPETKAAAWADLCRALALVRGTGTAAVP